MSSTVVPFPQPEGFTVPVHGSDLRVRILFDQHLAAKHAKGQVLSPVGRFELLDQHHQVVAQMLIQPAPMFGVILDVTGPEAPEGLPTNALYEVNINHFSFQVTAESAVTLLEHGFELCPPDNESDEDEHDEDDSDDE